MNLTRKTYISAGLAMALGLFSTGSFAAIAASSLFIDGEQHTLTDESGETAFATGESGELVEGDLFRGTANFGTLSSVTRPSTGIDIADGYQQLTAFFQLKVAGITNIRDDTLSDGTAWEKADFSFEAAGSDFWDGTSGALPNSIIADLAGTGVNLDKVVGVFYSDNQATQTEYQRANPGGTVGAQETDATDGNLVWVASIDEAGDAWEAEGAPTNLQTFIDAIGLSDTLGTFEFGLSLTYRAIGWDVMDEALFNPAAPGNLVDLTGINGALFPAESANEPYAVWDKIDMRFVPVPEPSIVALMGLSLIGFGAAKVRQRRKMES